MISLLLLLLIIAFTGFYFGKIYLSIKRTGKRRDNERSRLLNAWQNVTHLQPFLESAIVRYGLSASISLERLNPYQGIPAESMNPEEMETYYSLLWKIAEELQRATTEHPVLQQAQPLQEILFHFKKASAAYESARQDYRLAAERYEQTFSYPLGRIFRRMLDKTK